VSAPNSNLLCTPVIQLTETIRPAKGGDVFTRLALRTSYTEKNARNLAKQLLETIEALHERRIVHRDLKPENLLLRNDFDDSAIILADFGFAKYLPENGKLTTRCGTPAFAAPELIRPSCRCDEKVDTWAFGCLLYMLLGGYPPFRDKTLACLYRKIRVADYVFHAKVWDDVSVAAKRLISVLLTVNPSDRSSASEALKNPWISMSDDILDKKQLTASLGEIKKFHQRRSFFKNIQRLGYGKVVKSTGDLTEIDNNLFEDCQDPQSRCTTREKSDTILAVRPSAEFHDHYEMGSQIYAFQNTKVFKCRDKRRRQRLGVRVVDRHIVEEGVTGKTTSEMIFNEISILDSLRHRSIEKVFHVFEDDRRFYLTTEYFCGKDVFDQLQMFGIYDEDDVRILAWILIDAVAHMHSQGIVHRDLKPQHLLLRRRDCSYDIIVSGFGCACRVHEPQSLTGRFGTPSYVAPEVLKNIPYDQAVDMWSIGVVLYTLICGKRPFEDADQAELFRKIRCGKWKFQGTMWRTVSPDVKALIVALLEVNPAKRITAGGALQSPWFAGSELLRRNKSSESEFIHDPELIIETTEVNPCIAGEFTRSLARFGSIQL
jgi:serine/threonine protein kinase